jgi:hypothetical protein
MSVCYKHDVFPDFASPYSFTATIMILRICSEVVNNVKELRILVTENNYHHHHHYHIAANEWDHLLAGFGLIHPCLLTL